VAERSEFVANYNFDDVRKVLEILVSGFREEQAPEAVNE